MERCISLRVFLGTSVVVLLLGTSPALCDYPGTTENIQEIFLGRCYDYRQVKYKSLLPQVSDNCTSLWDKFFKAFSYMQSCSVNMTRYDPFVRAAYQQLPENKTLLWSGVHALALEYSAGGRRYVSVGDTLIGYLLDGLVWCGQSGPPGVDYSRCPSWTDCPEASGRTFWLSASKTFASTARGEVVVILNGSRADRPAYSRTSIFGTHEIPFLNPNAVTRVMVFLIHSKGARTYETCLNGSLVLLKQDVTSRGFEFQCEENPAAILHVMCADNPSDKECRLAFGYNINPKDCGSLAQSASGSPVASAKPADRLWMGVVTALPILLSVQLV